MPHAAHARTRPAAAPAATALAEPRRSADRGPAEEPVLAYLDPDEGREGRRLRIALAVAAAVHLLLLALPAPESRATTPEPEEKKPVMVVKQVRFKPPEPPPVEPIPQQRATLVPVPDPTPDDPEPLRPLADLQRNVHDLPEVDLDVVIPDGPPPPVVDEPILVGGEVARPRGVYNPKPAYTEIARKARIEGQVILQLTLDRQGAVSDLQVLRGLPMGLTEAAEEVVRTWRYEPALLNGKPVPVYMVVTVHFGLN